MGAVCAIAGTSFRRYCRASCTTRQLFLRVATFPFQQPCRQVTAAARVRCFASTGCLKAQEKVNEGHAADADGFELTVLKWAPYGCCAEGANTGYAAAADRIELMLTTWALYGYSAQGAFPARRSPSAARRTCRQLPARPPAWGTCMRSSARGHSSQKSVEGSQSAVSYCLDNVPCRAFIPIGSSHLAVSEPLKSGRC
jgi:hypothetical protein